MPERETLKVEEIVSRLNRSLESIKDWLRSGECPFGSAHQLPSGQWIFIIPRLAFENWMERGNTKTVQQIVISREDFDTLGKMIITR